MTIDEDERLRRVAALKEKKRLEEIEKEAVRRRINEDRVRRRGASPTTRHSEAEKLFRKETG